MGRRLPSGRKPKDSCAVLVALAGALIGLGAFMGEAARWVL
ncbi:hypothetical protein [Streptomyces sp.]